MHWLLFIQKILFSSTCFKPQVLIFRRIQLYTCSVWYCHSLREFLGDLSVHSLSEYTAWVLTQAVYRQATRNSRWEWQYHMLHVYNCILLKMSTWGPKHAEENSILWINNNQCIKVGNYYTVKNWLLYLTSYPNYCFSSRITKWRRLFKLCRWEHLSIRAGLEWSSADAGLLLRQVKKTLYFGVQLNLICSSSQIISLHYPAGTLIA